MASEVVAALNSFLLSVVSGIDPRETRRQWRRERGQAKDGG